jgi:hypothetical protein
MKIRPVGAELFHADGRTWRYYLSLFAILPTRLKGLGGIMIRISSFENMRSVDHDVTNKYHSINI